MRLRPGASWALAAVAFCLGVSRALRLPMPSDVGFHLLGVGNELLTGSLSAFARAPAGEHAPLLGSLLTAFLGLFGGGAGGTALLTAGSILLGLSAAVVVRELARDPGPAAALLALAMLLLPAAAASTFPFRPDLAAGGLFLAVALARARHGRSPIGVLAPATLAALCTPWAIPPAAALLIARAARRSAWIAPMGAVAGVACLSALLPAGSRGEILRGLIDGVSVPGSLSGVGDTLLRVWGAGLLFVAPPLLPFLRRDSTLPPDIHVAWLLALVGPLLAGAPGEFRGAAALQLPLSALLGAQLLHALPDPGAGRGPRRAMLVAMLLPVFLLFSSAGADRRERARWSRVVLREAEVATFLLTAAEADGDLVAPRTGPYRLLPGRAVRSTAEGALGEPRPRYVVLSGGRLPVGADESRIFADPVFLARYVPLEFRHGEAQSITDVVWLRTDDFGEARPEYATSLRAAWEAEDAGDDPAALSHYRQARPYEPPGRARALEGLGLLFERGRAPEQAERYFEEARHADPFAVRARGHLIDRALARGGILRADSLVTEAIRANPHFGEMAGTRARLFSAARLPREAVLEGERAVRLHPSARIVANWGIFLWRNGQCDLARDVWGRAVRTDPAIVNYLGDFRNATDDMAGPPTLPLFTDAEFAPPPSPFPGPERDDSTGEATSPSPGR